MIYDKIPASVNSMRFKDERGGDNEIEVVKFHDCGGGRYGGEMLGRGGGGGRGTWTFNIHRV